MITLTYTDEMKQQDALWETENEDLALMKQLNQAIVTEAKTKGFTGIVDIYLANNEIVSEVYESQAERDAAQNGTLDLQGENMSGYCKPLIKHLEAILNK